MGQTIEKVYNERKSAGIHKLNFDGSKLPNGIYLCILEHEKGRLVERIFISN